MFWFWVNMPLAAAFFAAWAGIPLWMVLRRPTWGPEPADGHRRQPVSPEPVTAVDGDRYPARAMAA
jgi:hypothetical protein